MSLRYKADFLSETNKNYTINIFDTEASGSVSEFCTGPDGFTINWEGQVDNIWQEIVPSKCEFDFIIEDQDGEDFIFECATGEPNRFKVYIESVGITPTLIWQGYLQGEGIEIEDEDWPTSVRLGCSDLGYLEDLPYMLSGAPITGEQSITDTILNVLEIAGHKEFYDDGVHSHSRLLATIVDWWAENMPSPVTNLHDAARMSRINQTIWYSGKGTVNEVSCKKVIEDCCRLFGCRFFQSAGLYGSVFNFAQIDDYTDGELQTTWYNTDGTQNSATNYLSDVEVDRVSIFQNGGRTSIVPGVKYSSREYKLQRNYLENITADNATPLNATFDEIWPLEGNWPVFSWKFNIKFKVVDLPTISGGWTPGISDSVYVTPMFRLKIEFYDGVSVDYVYKISPSLDETTPFFIQKTNKSKYLGGLALHGAWINNQYGDQDWKDKSTLGSGEEYSDILNGESAIIDLSDLAASLYVPQEINIPVEVITKAVPGVLPGKMEDLNFSLDVTDLFNTRHPEWFSVDASGSDINDYVEWRVEDFELIVHAGAVEENPQTAIKYKGTSPDNYRKSEDLSSAGIVNYDERALNGLKSLNTLGRYAYDELWYRGTATTDLLDLNKMSVREAIAMTKRGLYFWQGNIIDRSSGDMKFIKSVMLRNIRHIIVQARWEARMNNWSNLYLLEVARDQTGITIEEYNSETSSSKVGGGGSSGGGGGVIPTLPPEYEFASGVTASAFEPTIDMGGLASGSNDDINIKLWVFQDATKLHYPTGYDIDFPNNLIIPTYEFEDSNIELYLFP